MIAVQSVSCTLGATRALSEISLEIARGEFVTLLGPNGAGKTTLLRALLGIVPISGLIELNSKPLERFTRKELARTVSYVPQASGALPDYTVDEFLAMARYPYHRTFSYFSVADKKVVRAALECTDCHELADRLISSLSGGERQRIMLAAALCQESAVLLLDEPAAFLDPSHEDEIYRVLAQVNHEQEKTILMVTHDVNRAAIASQRVLGLKSGSLCFDGSPDDLMCKKTLHMLYGTSFLLTPHPESGTLMAVPKGSSDE